MSVSAKWKQQLSKHDTVIIVFFFLSLVCLFYAYA